MKPFIKISLYVFMALAVCLILCSVQGVVYSLLDMDYISAAVYGISAFESIISFLFAYLLQKS